MSCKEVILKHGGSMGTSLKLLACSGSYSQAKLYGAKIYINNTLAYDMVPAEQNGLIGLYDKITKKLYSSGTATSLIAGPEIKGVSDE